MGQERHAASTEAFTSQERALLIHLVLLRHRLNEGPQDPRVISILRKLGWPMEEP